MARRAFAFIRKEPVFKGEITFIEGQNEVKEVVVMKRIFVLFFILALSLGALIPSNAEARHRYYYGGGYYRPYFHSYPYYRPYSYYYPRYYYPAYYQPYYYPAYYYPRGPSFYFNVPGL